MSELTALIVAYHRVKGTTVTEDSVTRIFNAFMKNVATYKRPFYFHTGEGMRCRPAAQHACNARLQQRTHKFHLPCLCCPLQLMTRSSTPFRRLRMPPASTLLSSPCGALVQRPP